MSVQYIRLISGENVVADVIEDTAEGLTAVSYTHLTLPTICSV